MKRKLFVTLALVLAILFSAQAQHDAQSLRSGAYTWKPLAQTDYSFKDIKGNQYNLDAILKEGKFVLIDFSAVWCPPCWGIHTSGILEKIYNELGPKGAQKVELFWVEGDPGNDAGEDVTIHGGGNSKGDWTKTANGEENPVPIVSAGGMYPTIIGTRLEIFPSMVLISPTGLYIEDVSGFSNMFMANEVTPEVLLAIMNSAPKAMDVPTITRIFGNDENLMGSPAIFDVEYSSVLEEVSFQWTFENANVPTSNAQKPTVIFTKEGEQKVTITLTNANGKSETKLVRVKVDAPKVIDKFPYVIDFNDRSKIDIQWCNIDVNNDGWGWETLRLWFIDKIKLNNEDGVAEVALEGNNSACSWSFLPLSYNGGWDGESIEAEDYLISPRLRFAPDATKIQLEFLAGSFGFDPHIDNLSVAVSTSNNPRDIGSFKEVIFTEQKLPRGKNKFEIDLSAYKGQEIFVAFIHKDKDAFGVLLDDIRFTSDGTNAIDLPDTQGTHLYPTKNNLRITGQNLRNVSIYDIKGLLLGQYELKGDDQTILDAPFQSGCYLVNVESVAGTETFRIFIPE